METLEANLSGDFKASAWISSRDGRVYQGRLLEKQAQFVGVPGITAVDLPILLQEIFGLLRPAYNLRNVARIITMDALKATIPVYTKLSADEKVPELTESAIVAGQWGTVTFDLWKNVVHLVVSDEAIKRANVDIFGTQARDAAGALAKSENSQIATELEKATTVTGNDWGNDANNPYGDIVQVMSEIGAQGYPPDLVAAHPLVWGNFFGNKFVKGQLLGAAYPDLTKAGGFPIPGLPGVTGYSDFALTNTIAIVGARNAACVLGAGPTEAAKYRNERAGYDAYIIRQWLQPQLILAQAIRKITGVHA